VTEDIGRFRRRVLWDACPFASLPLLLFFLLFLFSCHCFAISCSWAATVAAVIDGDTIRLEDGTTVRYLGVNTPEYGQPFYEEAKRFNEQLVIGKSVRLETRARKQDKYRRTLAYVFVDDVLVNLQIVATGWGHVFLLEPLPQDDEWLRLQKQAQDQHKGIWRDEVRGPVKITTVHADAKGDDQRNPNGEYLRLCNISDQPVGLQGFAVQDAARHRFVFPAETIPPGYTALVVSGSGYNTTRRGQLILYWGAGPIWNNDGDVASLFDPEGKLIDSFQVLPMRRR